VIEVKGLPRVEHEATYRQVRVFDATMGRRFCRGWTEDALDGLARATGRPGS
jgi:hypothetical protein